MRRIVALALASLFVLQSVAVALPPLVQDVVAITNADVLRMVAARIPADVIVEKIRSTPCTFDTFPTVLTELKQRGVPDEVLRAMVKAPRGRAAVEEEGAAPAPPRPVRVMIPSGTPVEVEAAYTVNSSEVEDGSALSFRVVRPVVVDGVVVIRQGASATGRVVRAKKGGSWGRAGTLAWMMQDVVAADNTRVTLNFERRTQGDSKGGTVATGAIVTGVLLWPIAPVALLWGFKKGKNAVMPAGKRFEVFVHGDATVASFREAAEPERKAKTHTLDELRKAESATPMQSDRRGVRPN